MARVTVSAAMFIMMIALIAIPILIGIYVYRDAKRRAMNAALWTLIALLAPGFIGLIIYLIVRSEVSDFNCPQCGRQILESFSVCPYCGAMLTEKCRKCSFPLESGWVNCPQCGEAIPEEQRARQAPSVKKDKSLHRILIAVVAVPLLFCILMVSAIVCFTAQESISQGVIPEVSLSAVCEKSPKIKSWIDECDASGKGVYLLKTVTDEGREKKTKFLLYRNDGSYWVTPEAQNGGWFKKPVMVLDCSNDELSDTEYTLAYFEYTSSEECTAQVKEYGESIGFIEKTTDDIGLADIDFAPEELAVELEISGDVNTVYGVSFNTFSADANDSEYCQNADNSAMHREAFHYQYFGKMPTEISIMLYDADGNIIFDSGKIETNEISNWKFKVKYNADGALEMVQQ